jgi:hypothetical protein
VQGYSVVSGPPVRVYDHIEYVVWLLSSASSWMPQKHRACLIEGMRTWAVWLWDRHSSSDSEFVPNAVKGSLSDSMYRCRNSSKFHLSKKSRMDLASRFEYSRKILDLPESAETLVEDFLREGFIKAWIDDRSKGKRS